jgi:hypothetical protein
VRVQNLDLAFAAAESNLALDRLLDADGMAAAGTSMGRYDEKSVMTYVIELRKRTLKRAREGGGPPPPAAPPPEEEEEEMDDDALNALVAQNLAEEEITFEA